MADDSLILVLVEELLGTRECNLVDVLVDLLGGHTDTAVGDGQRLGILVGGDVDSQITQLAVHDTRRRECLEFLCCVYSIRNQFAQEDFVIRVEKLFDYGEDVFGRYPDFTCCHIF